MNEEKINYCIYQDSDANIVCDLLKRNKFHAGGFDKNLNPASLKKYNEEKGFIFGIVGKIDGKAVTYLGAFKFGSNSIAQENQIIIGCILVDNKYKKALFSIDKMFQLLLKKVIDYNYDEMISEVNINNLDSLYMMRKTGFILLDNQKTCYDDVVLHSYVPLILKSFECFNNEISNKMFLENVQPFNKKNLFSVCEYLSKNIIKLPWNNIFQKLDIYIDIKNNTITGIEIKNGFSFFKNGSCLLFKNIIDNFVILFEFNDGHTEEKLIKVNNNHTLKFRISNNKKITRFKICIPSFPFFWVNNKNLCPKKK